MRFAITAALALAACTPQMTTEKASTASFIDLCRSNHWSLNTRGEPDTTAVAALVALHDVPKRDITALLARAPYVGMSERTLRCMWGDFFDGVNTTQTARSTDRQYVLIFSAGYVYTRAGRVYSIQM